MRRVLGMAVAALVLPGAVLQGQADFEWTGRLARGKTIQVWGITGDVLASTAPGDEVMVTAVKREGRRGNPDDVRIEVVEHDDGVTICALYPTGRRGRENECLAGGGGHNETRDNDTRVEFTVRVPAGVRFDAGTVNGDVEVRNLQSDTEVRTVNGGVDVSTSGYAEASTVNGSIDAVIGSTSWPGHVDFRTVNGGITLELPAGAGADVEAETVNGDITSDFPLTVSGRFGPRRLRGTIGAGGPALSLQTVNGSIRIRKTP
jgi:hypothetical protein